MKTISAILLIQVFTMAACNDKETFVDLETGKSITVIKDSATGYMVNAETKQPVTIYVDTKTNDTLYGKTGKVINNLVIKTADGKYTYQDETEIKVTDEGSGVKINSDDDDYKKKVEKDGDIKIKDGDTKIKIEADGEKKIKKD